jgi:16S rRNA (guanine527-N7)-methyltransferase
MLNRDSSEEVSEISKEVVSPEFISRLTLQLETALKMHFPELLDRMDVFALWIREFLNWNTQINLISRKDTERFVDHHILPSLAFLKVMPWPKSLRVLDVGTGGGFPGMPLAIACQDVKFTLVDSIAKKIRAVNAMVEVLELKNVYAFSARVESLPEKFDVAVGRAVAAIPEMNRLIRGKLQPRHGMPSGLVYLKGGPLESGVRVVKKYPLHNLVPSLSDEGKYIVKL